MPRHDEPSTFYRDPHSPSHEWGVLPATQEIVWRRRALPDDIIHAPAVVITPERVALWARMLGYTIVPDAAPDAADAPTAPTSSRR